MEHSCLVSFLDWAYGGWEKKKGRWHVRDPIMVVHGGVWAFSHACRLSEAPLLVMTFFFLVCIRSASGHRCIFLFPSFSVFLYLTGFFFFFGFPFPPLPPHSIRFFLRHFSIINGLILWCIRDARHTFIHLALRRERYQIGQNWASGRAILVSCFSLPLSIK